MHETNCRPTEVSKGSILISMISFMDMWNTTGMLHNTSLLTDSYASLKLILLSLFHKTLFMVITYYLSHSSSVVKHLNLNTGSVFLLLSHCAFHQPFLEEAS
jgi:hypothetical protein